MSYPRVPEAYPSFFHSLVEKMEQGTPHIEFILPAAQAMELRKKFYGYRSSIARAATDSRRPKSAQLDYANKYRIAMMFESLLVAIDEEVRNSMLWTKYPPHTPCTLIFRHKDTNPMYDSLNAQLASMTPRPLDDLLGAPTEQLDSIIADIFK